MTAWVEWRLLLALTVILLVPGWGILALSDLWRRYSVLQRWILAVALSIAFYPVFFYVLRAIVPWLTLGPYKMATLLLAGGGLIVWRMRKDWMCQFEFDKLEWLALAMIGMTLFTRIWVIREHPYPAWSDSLHHTLLTNLTAQQGQLPITMAPYFPIPLDQYHLGFYSLTATSQWLAQVPAHTALLWTAQILNGLCGIGVYFVLDRRVGRIGAVVGAAVVGLLSHQPAFYVNWGRFTQLSSQTILLISWLVTWEAIGQWKRPARKTNLLWSMALSVLLTGAVFLLHFRVAVFYLPLLAISVVWELWEARGKNRVKYVIAGTTAIGMAALLVVSFALISAVPHYVSTATLAVEASQAADTADDVAEAMKGYYEFSQTSWSYLAGHEWLIAVAGLGAVIGLLRRNSLIVISLIWAGILWLLGNAYVIGIPLLNVTNLGAVLIMFYLPIGMIIGASIEVLAACAPQWRDHVVKIVATLVLGAGFIGSHARVIDIEPFRYFVTPQDVAAMTWIRENTPEDAVFAVNTHFWLSRSPHGTDAGYWIPYFTGRQTTAGAMLFSLASGEYQSGIAEMSRVVECLEIDNTALEDLYALGVSYIYVGQMGDFSGAGLNVAQLVQAENLTLVYQNAGVSVLQIKDL